MLLNVLNEGLPNDEVLCLWLQWFHTGRSSICGHVVLSWILIAVFQNPIQDKVNQQLVSLSIYVYGSNYLFSCYKD